MTYMFIYVWPLGSRHTWRTINVHSPIRFRNSRPKPDQGDNLFTLLWAQSHGETAIRRRNLTTPSGYSLTAENGVAATGTRGAAGAAAGGPVSQLDNGYEKKKNPVSQTPWGIAIGATTTLRHIHWHLRLSRRDNKWIFGFCCPPDSLLSLALLPCCILQDCVSASECKTCLCKAIFHCAGAKFHVHATKRTEHDTYCV